MNWWVRSGGFFDDDDPSEGPPLSTAMALLLIAVSISGTVFTALVLFARVSLVATG